MYLGLLSETAALFKLLACRIKDDVIHPRTPVLPRGEDFFLPWLHGRPLRAQATRSRHSPQANASTGLILQLFKSFGNC